MRPKTAEAMEAQKAAMTAMTVVLVKRFKKMIATDWGQDIFVLALEYFVDGYRIMLYPMDKDESQLGAEKILADILTDGPFADYATDNAADNADIKEYGRELLRYYMNWVSECFLAAGGADMKTPVFLSRHDGGAPYNLKTKEQGWEFYPKPDEDDEDEDDED